ncbi:MAG: phosphoglucosamine mutase, partial [Parvibaculales bacterium]
MERKYFGTDGIRGRANSAALTPEIALRVGLAAGRAFLRGSHRHRAVIGKDTRLSGYMLEPALVAGLTAMGMDVFLFGPLPTPAIAFLTPSLRADLGIMITASHNSFTDNGIKLFGPDGCKLSDELEAEIETLMDAPLEDKLVASESLGRAKRVDDAQARYIEYVKKSVPKNMSLAGLRIVIDCANGAAYKVAPLALWELGGEIICIGVEPDGMNINKDCGSTAPNALQIAVKEHEADIGFALDGDGDRILVCDEKGRLIDGDQILAIIAKSWKEKNCLPKNTIIATTMSNMGLESYLGSIGIKTIRTKVGDRYVLEAMKKGGFSLGGEQSGHIILGEYCTTGDGLMVALQLLSILQESKKPASALFTLF